MREADVVLVGGHSVKDDELKYGLSVTGLIHPEKVWTNKSAISGDKLILTKPLGSGIINTAVKGELADKDMVTKSVRCMSALNRRAAELMAGFDIHSCTDVTGFGLLGHASEMVEGTDVGMVIYTSSIPFFNFP